MSTELLELYELFEKKLGKEEAKKAIELVGKTIETIREEAKAQKPILKAEIKEELRKELVTKEEFFGEIGKLEQKIEALDQKIEFVRREMRILFYILLVFMFLLNKGTVEFAFKVLGLLK